MPARWHNKRMKMGHSNTGKTHSKTWLFFARDTRHLAPDTRNLIF
jgi:hypothetical protein